MCSSDLKHCSDFLDDSKNSFKYAQETAPSLAMQGVSKVLEAIFEFDDNKDLQKKLLHKGFGTEVIVTLRKT